MRLEPSAMAALSTRDPSAYRIAADWLLERGDPRGEFILDELALSERPNPSTRKAILSRRAGRKESLFAKWEEPLRALGATECEYHWGFIDSVQLDEGKLKELPKLLELEPITRLTVWVQETNGLALAEAMRSPAFAAIRELTLAGPGRAPLQVAAPNITSLTLPMRPMRPIDAVCEHFQKLERLSINGGTYGDDAVDAVAQGRLKVRSLWAPRCGVTSPSVTALARSSQPLEFLSLANNDLDASSMRALGASQGLSKLRELDLRGRRIDHHGFLTTGLPALKKLRVRGPSQKDRALYAGRGISLY